MSTLNNELCDASSQGDYKKVSSLISEGADANCQDSTGWTPLLLAAKIAKSSVKETLNILLENGADLRKRVSTPNGYFNAIMFLDQRSLEDDELESAIRLLEAHNIDRPNGWHAKIRETKWRLRQIRGQ